MTELKCPFCGEKLQQTFSLNPKQFWCSNYYNHKPPINLQGTKELWQALIDTKKKLDIALKELKASDKYYQDDECIKEAIKKIEQINQKEEK